MAWARRARALAGPGGGGATGEVLGPLAPAERGRWLTALVGSAAAGWPLGGLAGVAEPALAEALTGLARRLPPAVWTWRDVEAAALGLEAAPRRGAAGPEAWAGTLDAGRAAALALAIARVPPDAGAIAEVERRDDAPAALVLAAADALRRSGEYGRARSLVLRPSLGAEAAAPAAEVLRRAGDLALAEKTAADAVAAGADPEGRARAVLARLAFDRGDRVEAERLCAGAASPAVCEVAALCAAARGDTAGALAQVARGEALASSAEERARLAAMRGYVGHASDPEGTLAAYAAAVDHAVRAGAVVEEATYRTGEAAAAADLGELGTAVATARRAALLWEHLGRPALAARALLAAAAAYATAGAVHEARLAAREAMARARDGGDTRAEAYALWTLADAAPAGSAEGLAAAERASGLLGERDAGPEDQLRGGARLLRHGGLGAGRVAEIDRLAAPPLSAVARLDWWGARAEGARAEGPPAGSGGVDGGLGAEAVILGALVALADAPASIGARGRALAAGVELAARSGQGDVAQRLLSSLGEAARDLSRRAPPELSASVRALPWVTRAAAAPGSVLRPEQARDLESLIRALGERERLGPLLNRIVDALVLWTGVERGLLLMRAPDGRLVPRAARNLARADLTGEQMALSQTLAQRALAAREPVVAVDAEGELSTVHAERPRAQAAQRCSPCRSWRGARRSGWSTSTIASAAAPSARASSTGPAPSPRWPRWRSPTPAIRCCSAAPPAAPSAPPPRSPRRCPSARPPSTWPSASWAAPAGGARPASPTTRSSARAPSSRRCSSWSTGSPPPTCRCWWWASRGSGKELVARAIHDNGPRAGARLRGRELRRHPGAAARVGALRPRARRLHRRRPPPRRPLRGRRRRHPLPRRDRRDEPRACRPSSCACCEDGEVRPVGGRAGAARSTCASSPPPTATSTEMVKQKTLPRGPLLPPQRHHRPHPAAPRAPRRHPAAGRTTSWSKHAVPAGEAGEAEVRVTAAAMDGSPPSPGPATSASSRTRCAAPSCSPTG